MKKFSDEESRKKILASLDDAINHSNCEESVVSFLSKRKNRVCLDLENNGEAPLEIAIRRHSIMACGILVEFGVDWKRFSSEIAHVARASSRDLNRYVLKRLSEPYRIALYSVADFCKFLRETIKDQPDPLNSYTQTSKPDVAKSDSPQSVGNGNDTSLNARNIDELLKMATLALVQNKPGCLQETLNYGTKIGADLSGSTGVKLLEIACKYENTNGCLELIRKGARRSDLVPMARKCSREFQVSLQRSREAIEIGLIDLVSPNPFAANKLSMFKIPETDKKSKKK